MDSRRDRHVDLTFDDYLALYGESYSTAVWCQDFEWSIADLDNEIAAYAGGLKHAGVGIGDVVAVYGNSRPECLAAFLACCRIGAVYLGLSPKQSSRELEFIFSDATPKLVLAVIDDSITSSQRSVFQEFLTTHGDTVAVVADEVRGATSWVDFLRASGPVAAEARECSPRPCAIVYTSGSTGTPKGALLSEVGCVRSALLTWQNWYGGDTAIRAIVQHPINHVSWLVCEALAVLVGGGALFFRERFDAASTLKLIEHHRLTLWLAFPTMVALVMRTDAWAHCDLNSLTRIAFGSSPQAELLRRLRDRTNCIVSTSYGLTEAHGGALTATADEDDVMTVTTTIGRPVPGPEFRIVDETGHDVQPHAPGELLVRDATVFLGYLNLPEVTARAIDPDGWLHTGDIVVETVGGALVLTGRMTEMFKSGGYNVYPAEIENLIGAHGSVIEAVVVDVPDPLWSAVGVAFIVPVNYDSFSTHDLLTHLKSKLSNYKVPKDVVVVRELPRLANNKVDRPALRMDAFNRHVPQT